MKRVIFLTIALAVNACALYAQNFTANLSEQPEHEGPLQGSFHVYKATYQANITGYCNTVLHPASQIKAVKRDTTAHDTSIKTNPNFEPLFYVGTNFDLLDGLQAKSLYAKFNLFWKLTDNNYLQLGIVKNRLFSSGDSVNNIPLFDGFRTRQNLIDTTISLVRGFYSKKVVYKNEPLTLYFEYHRKLPLQLSDNVSIFVSGGLEIGLFKTTITNTISHLVTDTTIVKVTGQRFAFENAIVAEHTFTKPNYLYYGGLMFLYDNDDFNVKLQTVAGLNSYFNVMSSTNIGDVFIHKNDPYFNLKFNSIIKKVGIGFGAEVLVRRSTVPLFGLTLSKVIDMKDIKSVFSGVSTMRKTN